MMTFEINCFDVPWSRTVVLEFPDDPRMLPGSPGHDLRNCDFMISGISRNTCGYLTMVVLDKLALLLPDRRALQNLPGYGAKHFPPGHKSQKYGGPPASGPRHPGNRLPKVKSCPNESFSILVLMIFNVDSYAFDSDRKG